jgi:hypothetical protein
MEGIVAPGAQMWSAGGAGRSAMTRVGTGRREPGYFNMQEPLYVNCPNPTPTPMAKPEEEHDSELDEGSALGQAFHEIGECSPCAYFWQKADGCRLGDECKYCHLCDRDAIRRWKKAKKQRKKADAIRSAPTSCNNSYKKPAGVVNMPKRPAGVVNTSKNLFTPAAIEPARVSLPVSMQPSKQTGLASLVGMSRPYLPLGVPPGLGFDYPPVAAGKMGLNELIPDDDGTCFGPPKQSLVNDITTLGGADSVESNCQPKIPKPQASPNSRSNAVQFGNMFPYFEQRYADVQ